MRSMRAVRLLEELGYTRLGHFGGGIREWRRAGFEIPHS
jgi:rhodanese-related sulfurtransferase